MRAAAIAVAALLCGFGGCTTEDDAEVAPPPGGGMLQAPIAAPSGASLEEGYIGVITARGQADVFAPFTTEVAEVFVKLGDLVKEGDMLARLDDDEIKQELKIAKAELRTAYVSASAARSKLRREKKGFKDSVSSKADVEAASFDSRKASASAGEQKARIDKLEQKLAQATITAPLAGKIALLYVQPGGRIEEGLPVIKVVSSEELYVKFAIPAKDAGKNKPGDPIDVVVVDRGTKLKGTIKSVAPELDSVAQMIVAEAELDATQEQLHPNSKVRVRRAAQQPAPGSGSGSAPSPSPSPNQGSASGGGSGTGSGSAAKAAESGSGSGSAKPAADDAKIDDQDETPAKDDKADDDDKASKSKSRRRKKR